MSRKRNFAVAFFLLCSFILNAAEGNMWGEKQFRVIKTQWFDIIYPPSSAESAARLAQSADDIYAEIAGLYGYEPYVRLPVILSPKVEEFNAYYTSVAYDRIVIFDTASSASLSVFSDELLSTFRHELTHAYTFNLKNGFWRFIGDVLGDCVSPASFILSGWAEGATLTSESANGEGRLNDEYSLHVVKQAKLENQFPEYHDMHGVSDQYPSGSYYYFNGAFNKWLQDTYGMEKYAEFWYKCDNFYTFALEICFKKIYGISVTKAWRLYRDSFSVPEIPGNPLMENQTGHVFLISDFFSGDTEEYSTKNNSGAIYSSLSKSDSDLAYINSQEAAVYLNGKKLFIQNGISKVSLSKDSRFMALSYTDYYTPVYTKKVRIYDLQKKSFFSVPETGIRDASILVYNGDYFLVMMGFESQKKWIEIKKVMFDEKGGISDLQDYKKIILPYGFTASSFIDLSDDSGAVFAFVKNNHLIHSICVMKLETEEITEYSLSYEKMVIKGLSASEDLKNLYFSWTIPGTMPRFGALNRDSENFALSEKDFSGGVFAPVQVSSGDFVYEGHFFRQNRLFSIKSNENDLFSKTENAHKSEYIFSLPVEDKSFMSILDKSEKYSPFNGYKGIVIPFSTVQTLCLQPNPNMGIQSETCFLGATYVSTNPWGANVLQISAGMDPFTLKNGLSTQITGGSDTDFFSWSAMGQIESNLKVLTQIWGKGSLNFHIPVGRYPYIGITYDVLVSAENLRPQSGKTEFHLFNFSNTADVWFSTVHKCGSGYQAFSGITIGVEAGNKRISPYSNIYIPKLIPVDCKFGYTYNFPLKLRAVLFPENFHDASFIASLCLFSMEIQKGLPFLPVVFINRFYVNGGYNGKYDWEPEDNLYYTDFFFLKGVMGVTPNFTKMINFELYTTLFFSYRNPINGKPDFEWQIGFSGSL
ncbi:MAG: hypothetical protein MJ182_07660 [Treponema sp.]|nr:hypothetical protein [Treponema sp.]